MKTCKAFTAIGWLIGSDRCRCITLGRCHHLRSVAGAYMYQTNIHSEQHSHTQTHVSIFKVSVCMHVRGCVYRGEGVMWVSSTNPQSPRGVTHAYAYNRTSLHPHPILHRHTHANQQNEGESFSRVQLLCTYIYYIYPLVHIPLVCLGQINLFAYRTELSSVVGFSSASPFE